MTLKKVLPVIGWREWIALPALGVDRIKVKVDTGARSSALHAFDLETFQRKKQEWVRFVLHPLQRDSRTTIVAEAPVLEWRTIKSSSGHGERRPVIETPVELFGQRWDVEITLTNRDTMGFRMLLGRQAVRGHFFVDPGGSYHAGKPARKVKKKKKAKRATKAPRRDDTA